MMNKVIKLFKLFVSMTVKLRIIQVVKKLLQAQQLNLLESQEQQLKRLQLKKLLKNKLTLKFL